MEHRRHITDEEIKESALQFSTRNAWKLGDYCTYRAACRRKTVDQWCAHMTRVGNTRYREWQVYRYAWPQLRVAYLGITCVPNRRHKSHFESGPVASFTKLHGPSNFAVLHYSVDADNAATLERKYIKEYPKNGWTLLNKSAGGSLGAFGLCQWTRKAILEDAKRYSSKSDWYRNHQAAYAAALRAGLLAEATSHMVRPPRRGSAPKP